MLFRSRCSVRSRTIPTLPLLRASSSRQRPSPRLSHLLTQVRLISCTNCSEVSCSPTHKARKLASFSTPNFGKSKPPPLNYPSAFDNNPSYVNVSSAESTPHNASSSRVPAKRLSTGAPEDVVPRVSPKRPKTSHQPDKENEFQASSSQDKGKARARDLYTPSRCSPLPALSIPSNPRLPYNATASTLRAAFEALPHVSGLGEVWQPYS